MKSAPQLVLALVVASLLLPAPAGAAGSKSCRDATLVPKRADQMMRMQRATRCLVNRERTRHGLKILKVNSPLQEASAWQAQDMLDNEYFEHSRPGGPEFSERILRFGYAEGAGGYTIGENIAWASAPIATPRKIVKLWMNSPPHRKNILTRAYRDQAVAAHWSGGGVGGDYAGSAGPFVIFVNQFGARF